MSLVGPPYDAGMPDLQITSIDLGDDAALERFIQFEIAHGTPRFHEVETAQQFYRTVDGLVLLIAERDGDMVGCAAGSTLAVLPGSVQINIHALDASILRALADRLRVEFGGQIELLAHVTAPTGGIRQMWIDAGFEHAGDRYRLERPLTDADRELSLDAPAGVTIEPLAARDDLVEQALVIWNDGHVDVPSALPFAVLTLEQWRESEFGLSEGDPLPDSLLIAHATGRDGRAEVVGVAYVNPLVGPGNGYGHRFTTVARAWRGRGIGHVLKRATVRHAALAGAGFMRSSNDGGNPGMLAINRAAGYEIVHTLALYRLAAEH